MKWEYWEVTEYTNDADFEMESFLNDKGQRGWELVHMNPYNGDTTFTFKRSIEEPDYD